MSESELRILVVDDEAAIRHFLRASLSAHGHKVFEVATGNGAISEVAARHPDLVILDLGLPNQDGLNVVRRSASGRLSQLSSYRCASMRPIKSMRSMLAQMAT